MNAQAVGGVLGGIIGLLFVVVVGWVWPIRLAHRAAARAGKSPHWVWFGLYPFAGWAVWALMRRKPAAVRCTSCGNPLRPGLRFCDTCAAPIPGASAADGAVRSVDWLRASAPCLACSNPVKLTANACGACGAAAPRVACPRCGSNHTATKRNRAVIILGVLFLAPLGGVANLYTDPRTGAVSSPATLAAAMEWAVAFLAAAIGVILIYRAFTERGYVVLCTSCGVKQEPPRSPRVEAASPDALRSAAPPMPTPAVERAIGSTLVSAPAKEQTAARHDLASEAAVTYSLQHLLDMGAQPSVNTVAGWIARLEQLQEKEILRLHGDIDALKRYLSS